MFSKFQPEPHKTVPQALDQPRQKYKIMVLPPHIQLKFLGCHTPKHFRYQFWSTRFASGSGTHMALKCRLPTSHDENRQHAGETIIIFNEKPLNASRGLIPPYDRSRGWWWKSYLHDNGAVTTRGHSEFITFTSPIHPAQQTLASNHVSKFYRLPRFGQNSILWCIAAPGRLRTITFIFSII